MPVLDHELLVHLLGRIPDPRRRRGVRHPVGALIAVAVCAVVAGARGVTAMGGGAGCAPARGGGAGGGGGGGLPGGGLAGGGVGESPWRPFSPRLDADLLD